MNGILNIYKPVGLTPLQLIQTLRRDKQEYKDVKIGFAGRLDPLAHGVMLLMIGDETKNRNKYLSLPKEYEFEVLFGVSTDTYDTLGILNNKTVRKNPEDLEKLIHKFIIDKTGMQTQTFPPYSSKEVDGKSLFMWARENKLTEIKIPEKEIEIFKFELLKLSKIQSREINRIIIKNINSVDGDFRQDEILKQWSTFFAKNKSEAYSVAAFKIECSSGTYVRSLANELGGKIGTGAIAFSILRTKVGEYKLANSINL